MYQIYQKLDMSCVLTGILQTLL